MQECGKLEKPWEFDTAGAEGSNGLELHGQEHP